MSDNNEPKPPDNNGADTKSGEVRDPQVMIVAAAAFAGGLIGAIVGAMVT